MTHRECNECNGLIVVVNGYYVCSNCGLCSEEPVFEDFTNRTTEDNYRKQHRKPRIIEEDEGEIERNRVWIFHSIYEELKEYLKEIDITQTKFVSQAIADAMDKGDQ